MKRFGVTRFEGERLASQLFSLTIYKIKSMKLYINSFALLAAVAVLIPSAKVKISVVFAAFIILCLPTPGPSLPESRQERRFRE